MVYAPLYGEKWNEIPNYSADVAFAWHHILSQDLDLSIVNDELSLPFEFLESTSLDHPREG